MASILSSAQRMNDKLSITGMLLFDGDYFLQYLEGGRTNLNIVFSRIYGDDRHRNVDLISFREIEERICPNWSMEYRGDTLSNRGIVRRFSESDILDPRKMSAAALENIVRYIAGTEREGGIGNAARALPADAIRKAVGA